MMERHSHTGPSISVNNLSIGYPKGKQTEPVLAGINFEIQPGEMVCLIGANGTGKSTLIKTLAGLMPSISGEIRLKGKSLYDYSAPELSKEISLVLTDKINDDHLSVSEILTMGRHPYSSWLGILSENDKQVIRDITEKIALNEFTGREFCTLSDGEKQRVLIARALIQETSIILLDEPASFLDLSGRIEIMELLRSISDEAQRSVLVSSHDIELAIQYADRLIIITETGEIFDGFTEDLIAAGVFEKIFHEKLSFDVHTGKFRMKNRQKKFPVSLEGENQEISLIGNALLRNGFQVSVNAEVKIKAEKKEGRLFISLQRGDKLLSFLTVKELISCLKDEKS